MRISCGILCFVLKRGWSFVALGLLAAALIILLNFPPLLERYPGLASLSRAINASTGIIAAVVGGLFVQGLAIIYGLFKNAVQGHLDELKELATKFLDEIKKEKEMLSREIIVGPLSIVGTKLRIYYLRPLCTAFNKMSNSAEYGGLLEDMGVHWPDVDKSLNELKDLCNRLDEFNYRVGKLDEDIVEYIEELAKEYSVHGLVGLNPKNFPVLMMRIIDRLLPRLDDIKDRDDLAKQLESLCSREHIAEKCKKVYESLLRSAGGTKVNGKKLHVFDVYVGDISRDIWNKHGLNVVIDATARTLQKYCESLRAYYDEGYRLLSQARSVEDRVMKALGRVKHAKFLPLKTICEYLR